MATSGDGATPDVLLQEVIHVLENVQLAKYVVVASLCLLVYDYTLTAAEEYYLVWPSRWGTPKVLFFLNRYLSFIDPILLTLELTVGGNATFCVLNFQILGAFSSYGFIIAQVILMMRAWAIWERAAVVTTILATLLLAGVGLDVFILKHYLSGIAFIPSPASAIKGCLLSFKSRIVYVDFILVMVTETVMLILLAIKAIQHFRHSRSTLMVRMYRDGVFYYSFIVVTSVANLCTILTAPIELHNFLIVTQRVLHSIFCSRVLLHIRGAYSNKVEGYLYEDKRQAYANQSFSLQRYPARNGSQEVGEGVKTLESAGMGIWARGSAWGSDVLLSDSFVQVTELRHDDQPGHDDDDELDSDNDLRGGVKPWTPSPISGNVPRYPGADDMEFRVGWESHSGGTVQEFGMAL